MLLAFNTESLSASESFLMANLSWLGALTLEQAPYSCLWPNTWLLNQTQTFFNDCP